MTYNRISESVTKLSGRVLKSSPLLALLLVATFATAVPARAQSNDAWKSVVIIGGSTAAGAYIGHKVAGSTGAYVGAAVGASAGYAIDRRRRQNDYYSNNNYPNGDGGYYPDNGGSGYYGNNDPYYGNNDPNNGPYYGNGGYGDNSGYGYPGNGYAAHRSRHR
jgi:hypothetical protein